MMTVKFAALSKIFSSYFDNPSLQYLNIFMLLPPLVGPMCYCLVVSLVEGCAGVYNVMRRIRLRPRLPQRLSRSSDSAPRHEEIAEAEEDPKTHRRDEDRAVKPAPAVPSEVADDSQGARKGCCQFGIPLAFSAGIIVCLDIAEAVCLLSPLIWIGWRNTMVAAMVLKWGVLSLLVNLGEGVLRVGIPNKIECLIAPLDLWVRAHRMARDIFTAALILAGLLPLVLLNRLNHCLCPGLSLHNLLMYRNPNHLRKREAYLEIGP